MLLAGAANMFIAVGAGAFGAHGLKAVLTPGMLAIWQTGVTYEASHGLGLLLLCALWPRFSVTLLSRAALLMLAGIVLFSGSLYALALTGIRPLGAVTPFGGLCFLLAWATVVMAGWRRRG
ncbi:membrane protein [Silvimonas amylolytica]|uniref:Membrane protein n=2 Tax=Silvimonas amylolytica TaxID=449663 RepID=A0ABQ2PFZ7_9NEIS|nr:membrane protein [Silvimonas amylolytica]